MSKVDEELTRRLRRAERPVDDDDLFEGLARRRARREMLRKLQVGMLAFAVIAATAGGFVALRRAFDSGERNVGDEQTPSPFANGEIVFSSEGRDGYSHLYAIQPDGSGRRQITDFGTDDSDPAISPDGRTVAFVHQLEDVSPAIATVPIDGGTVTWLTDADVFVTGGPSWSPDGTRIAFAAHDGDAQRLFVMNANGTEERAVVGEDVHWVESPAWSPDGSLIAFTASPLSGDDDPSIWDVFTIHPDGTGLRNVTNSPADDEGAVTWSPGGDRIAFSLPTGRGSAIVVHRLSDGTQTSITEGSDVDSAPAWSPDGTLIAFDRAPASGGGFDLWVVRPDGSDPTRLTQDGGVSAAWQPIPAGSSPEPQPSPEPSPAALEGRDIGLGFPLCNIERLGGIDFLGDGTMGSAWTGNKAAPEGACPDNYDDRYGVAVDFTGDGLADSWSGETIEHCTGCEPFKAADLNGDGKDDLIVTVSYFSIMQYGLYTVIPVDGELQVVPFRTGEPGHSQHGLQRGRPFTFWVGGDAGSADWFYCEALPELRLTGTLSPVDGGPDAETTVHETHVSLGIDGIAQIRDAQTYTVTGLVYLQYATSKPDCGLGVDIWRQ
jgi:TolB protein